jgi:hypothetical protein
MKALKGLVLVSLWLIIYVSILYFGMALSSSINCTDGIAETFYIGIFAMPAGLVFLIVSAFVGSKYGSRYFLLGAVIGAAVMAIPIIFPGTF